METGFKLHIDHPWSECVKDGAPLRIYLHTPWGIWQAGEKSQIYDRKTHEYADRFAFITYRPRSK